MQRSSIKQEPPFGAQPSPRGARPPERSDSPKAAAPPERPSAPRNPLGPSAPARPAPTGHRGGEPGRDLSLTARRARAQRVPPAHPPSGEPPASLGSRIPGIGGRRRSGCQTFPSAEHAPRAAPRSLPAAPPGSRALRCRLATPPPPYLRCRRGQGVVQQLHRHLLRRAGRRFGHVALDHWRKAGQSRAPRRGRGGQSRGGAARRPSTPGHAGERAGGPRRAGCGAALPAAGEERAARRRGTGHCRQRARGEGRGRCVGMRESDSEHLPPGSYRAAGAGQRRPPRVPPSRPPRRGARKLGRAGGRAGGRQSRPSPSPSPAENRGERGVEPGAL